MIEYSPISSGLVKNRVYTAGNRRYVQPKSCLPEKIQPESNTVDEQNKFVNEKQALKKSYSKLMRTIGDDLKNVNPFMNKQQSQKLQKINQISSGALFSETANNLT